MKRLPIFAFSLFCTINAASALGDFDRLAQLAEASDRDEKDRFGTATSISGDRLIVGARDAGPGQARGPGAAYIFEREADGEWIEVAKLEDVAGVAGDLFGRAVGIDGDVAVVGSRAKAIVFTRSAAGVWGAASTLTAASASVNFAQVVVVSGDRVVVSDPTMSVDGNTRQGGIFVFERPGNWAETAFLTVSDDVAAKAHNTFGTALALEDGRLVVGASGMDTNRGGVYIFEETGGLWTRVALLSRANASPLGGSLGASVALSGDRAAAGMPSARIDGDFSRGSALVFEKNGALWELAAEVSPADGRAFDMFGTSVALNGDTFVGGSVEAQSPTFSAGFGAVTVFRGQADGSWIESQSLSPDAGQDDEFFATALAIDDGTLLVGAPDSSGSAEGFDSGIIYIYRETATGLTEVAALCPSDSATDDNFGEAIALSGTRLAVGAPRQGSSNGAVYLYEQSVAGWVEVKKISSETGADSIFFGNALALSGDVLAVGVSREEAVYLYGKDVGGSGNWGLIKTLTDTNAGAFHNFGVQVALDGDRLVVGATGVDAGGQIAVGRISIFHRDAGGSDAWELEQQVDAPEQLARYGFGSKLALRGTLLAVSAPSVGLVIDGVFTTRPGQISLYERSGAGAVPWVLIKTISRTLNGFGLFSGEPVAVTDDTLAIGGLGLSAPGDVQVQGIVAIFGRNIGGAGNWGESVTLTQPDNLEGDGSFGKSISLSGDHLLVGADTTTIFEKRNQGAAYLFERATGGNWRAVGKAVAEDGEENNFAARQVELDGGIVAMSGIGFDFPDSTKSGAVFVFDISSPAGYESWRLAEFGAAVVGNVALEESVWGDAADPDHDGLPNLAEAYHDRDPQVSDIPPFSVAHTGGSLSYTWLPSASTNGVDIAPEWSPDLAGWFTSGEGGRTITTTSEGVTLTGTAPAFLRLRYSR